MFWIGLIIGTYVGLMITAIFSGRAYDKGFNDGWLKGMVERD